MATLREWLQEQKMATGLTQARFAERLGVNQATVAKLCGDEPKLSPDLAVKIERATQGAVPVEVWPQFAVLASRNSDVPAAAPTDEVRPTFAHGSPA